MFPFTYFIILNVLFATSKCYSSQYRNTNREHAACNTTQIEYMLGKLESETVENRETLKSEIRENNRRLEDLEWRDSNVQKVLESLRNDVTRFDSTGKNTLCNQGVKSLDTEKLERHFENSANNLENVAKIISKNDGEIRDLKKEMENIKNLTEKIFQDYQRFPNKELLNNALMEIKHGLNKRHASIEKCRKNSDDKPKDCIDLKIQGKKSGVYKIFPEDFPHGFMVLCEMETNGGGWTVIQNRFDGSQNFFLDWHDYKSGFGNLGGEFWLGLDYIHHLTGNDINELFIQLVDFQSNSKYAHYGSFSIGSEIEGYSLKLLSDYEGNAGNSLIYQAGSRFSTKNMDQDEWEEGSCSKSHGGGWWYKSCDTSNLNGKYLNGELPENFAYQGMYWDGFRGPQYSLKQVRMLVRPRDKANR